MNPRPSVEPRRWTLAVVALCLVTLASASLAACSLVQEQLPEQFGGPAREYEEATPVPLPPDARVVYLLGRSVTYGWFQSWGWREDDEIPVVRGRYVLYHRSIDGPEEMVASVRGIVNDIPDANAPAIHWKFCFDDFDGGDSAQESITRNQKIVQQVYQLVVEQHHHKLIIGNALPKVSRDTDPPLVAAERQFNRWLVQFQDAHAGQVVVFDQYSVLADSNGALRSNYATARDDSHPNRAGYAALDAPYTSLLDRVFGK